MPMARNRPKKPTQVPTKSKLKKDPGVPRLISLKARNADKQRMKNAHMKVEVSPRPDGDSIMASEPTLSTLAEQAQAQASSYSESTIPVEDGVPSNDGLNARTKEQIRKYYLKTLHKVISESDIIILVLDARDPEGCRSRLVEEEVRRREAEGKRLVFVLNKVDLIPKENAQAWLKHLRHSTPTLPFKCSHSSATSTKTTNTAPILLKLLKAYKPKAGSITVGVVGFPNVGKSSLINSLKRSKVCAIAAQPGHTKDLQSVQLERGIKIIDSPGVVFDENDEDDLGPEGKGKGRQKTSILLRNVVKVEDVDDPIEVVEEILARTPPETIQKIYNLPEFSSTLEFLTMLALSSGRLLKGGTPDLISTSRQVLTDWNHQKIPYFTTPPTIHPSSIPSMVSPTSIAPGAETVGQARVITQFSKPFVLDGLFDSAPFTNMSVDDDAMMDEDGDVFYDAQEGDYEEMDQDGFAMDADTQQLSPNPLKRYHSPTPPPSTTGTVGSPSRNDDSTASNRYARQPKRLRRSKDVDDGSALKAMGKSNPLNRRVLKKDRKKARRTARRLGAGSGGEAGMEVDDMGGGLGETFMV